MYIRIVDVSRIGARDRTRGINPLKLIRSPLLCLRYECYKDWGQVTRVVTKAWITEV
jgi:hypothetical protein